MFYLSPVFLSKAFDCSSWTCPGLSLELLTVSHQVGYAMTDWQIHHLRQYHLLKIAWGLVFAQRGHASGIICDWIVLEKTWTRYLWRDQAHSKSNWTLCHRTLPLALQADRSLWLIYEWLLALPPASPTQSSCRQGLDQRLLPELLFSENHHSLSAADFAHLNRERFM